MVRINFLLYVGFNVGQLAISIVVASHVFQLVADALIDIPAHNLPHINSIEVFAVLVATFLAYEVVNAVLVSIGITLTTPRRLSYSLKYSLKYLHIHFLTLGMIAILVSKIYFWEPDQPVNLLFVFIPLGLAHFSMRNYLRLREDSHSALMLISALLERRDEYTGEHSKDVTLLSVQLARALNLSDELIENIERGAEIHDIGKIGVPDAILLKLGPLTESEWEIMKEHPVIGAEILGKLEIYKDVVPIVLHEHEHWDGGGYPNGLKGETIPLGARVVAVADVYSALTTPRPYRLSQGRPLIYEHKEACEILREMAGKQLDPALVEVFVDDVDLGERLDKYLKESEAQDVNEQNQEEQA